MKPFIFPEIAPPRFHASEPPRPSRRRARQLAGRRGASGLRSLFRIRLLPVLAVLVTSGCTTVGESILPYREPVVRCALRDAVPVIQAGLPEDKSEEEFADAAHP